MAPKKPSHRVGDTIGVVLIAVGVVIGLALAFRNAGVVGQAMAEFLESLFGRGAWGSPVVLIGIGIAYLAGRKDFELSRLTWGLALIFSSVIAFMATAHRGDLFDPAAASSSGGYLGASLAWAMKMALGDVSGVGLGALLMIGLIMCVDMPLRELVQAIRKPKVRTIASKAPVDGPTSDDLKRAERKSALRDALVRLSDTTISGPVNADTVAAPVEQKTKARPVIKEPQTELPLLTTSGPTPKEGYTLPPLSLLSNPVGRPKRSAAEMQKNIETLEGTLEQFGIEANVVEVATGPTITRYEIQLGPGVRVGRITALGDNLAMDLAASHVRVEAPIPGKAAVGVEVPNSIPSMVTLREVSETKEFLDHPSRLIVALGQDVSGINRYTDLTKMPHLLIGGATNSGKSIGLATIITSLLMRNTPKDVRMVMIDPKRVELSFFDGIPHLMCPVVKDVKEAPGVLRAVWREMDLRYDKFSEAGVRNIDGWNAKASFADKLPYIVVIIDELADLMIQAAAEVETTIVRLAQLARAVGIHLVIATQRPSVDVITGTIKANIPSRMAFAVSSQIDSRTILDQAGAERLVGKGDMLFMPIDASKPTRIQGCYVSETEIEAVCTHWKNQEAPHYVLNPIAVAIADRERELSEQDDDPLWQEAVQFVVDRKQASTSMLQRRFSIGFQRASRLLDTMEERGIVGPRDGPRPREVLVDPMEAAQMFGAQYSDQIDLKIDLDDEE